MRKRDFLRKLNDHVLTLDGAMGTMIQNLKLVEKDFRGERFRYHPCNLKGCNDILVLTSPESVEGIHRAYLEAGADIIETDTFNANAISLAEYSLSEYVDEINENGARIARRIADEYGKITGRKRYVAGSIGPCNISLSMADTTKGEITFDILEQAYYRQAGALIRGGVDIILLETIFDTLNAKAAVSGVRRSMEDARLTGDDEIPLMLSVTLTETGRTLSGQTIEAFVVSMLNAGATTVGLNCGFGAEDMYPYLLRLQRFGYPVSIHPNAGLPDEMGNYTETPEMMAQIICKYLDDGLLNIVGGCCGTTPAHIKAIADRAMSATPRKIPADTLDMREDTLLLSGLELREVSPANGFLKVGERCNVAGSRKFLRLINEENYTEAVEIAAGQIEKGAGVLDINMDDGMLDSEREMKAFVDLLGLDVATAPLPLMIDSSDMNVINSALRRIQGRPVVNSISLKEGEEKFLKNAREIYRLGGAVVVMAFDENGQADTLERKIEICGRAYRLLTEKCGYKGNDIIFDPNILTIATGIPEHDRYALDFLDAIIWIKGNLPGAKVSGGVSNLSFAFRGINRLREAMHTVFLHHAIERGMDMAIVNPSSSIDISTVDPELRELIEDVIFCLRDDATERLLMKASELKMAGETSKMAKKKIEKISATGHNGVETGPVSGDILAEMVVKGVSSGLEPLLESALREEGSAMGVIKNRLMAGMNRVGDAFGRGEIFLPQVVRSSGVMKQAVAWLTPYIERESGGDTVGSQGKMVLATVKGDVHDIGKNIVAVVMRCAGFEVVDLGVMVDNEKIIEAARRERADFIGVSGLITPSLSEMAALAGLMERTGMHNIPLFVGGATTSDLHTAVRIAPEYSGLTIHTRDAASLPDMATALMDPERRDATAFAVRECQRKIRMEYRERKNSSERFLTSIVTDTNGRSGNGDMSWKTDVKSEKKDIRPRRVKSPDPLKEGIFDYRFTPLELEQLINWKAFIHVWQLPKEAVMERERVVEDARKLIRDLSNKGVEISARASILPAWSDGEDIVVRNTSLPPTGVDHIVISTLRRETEPYLSMSDFIAPEGENDHIGLFAVTVGREIGEMIGNEKNSDYESLLLQSLADRLVEAGTERLHTIVHEELWGLKGMDRGIRPAIGYPSLPDQSLVFEADKIIDYSSMGVKLTENGALWPAATTTGLIFISQDARYFEIGDISETALNDYANRRGLPLERIKFLLGRR